MYFKCKVSKVLLEIIPPQQFQLLPEMHKEKVQAEKDFSGRVSEPPAAGSLSSENCTCEQSCVFNHEHLGTRGGHAQAPRLWHRKLRMSPSHPFTLLTVQTLLEQSRERQELPKAQESFCATKTSLGPLIFFPQHTKGFNGGVCKWQITEQLKSQQWEKEQFPFLQIVWIKD